MNLRYHFQHGCVDKDEKVIIYKFDLALAIFCCCKSENVTEKD